MLRRMVATVLLLCWLLTACGRETAKTPSTPPTVPTSTFIKAVWMPYMQVEELLVSGDPAVCREAIASAMEDCRRRGINTVYFHVRANSDAYYASSIYPPNRAAEPLLRAGFDPLTVAVEEAHRRGLTLHAWINPYRIGTELSQARCDDRFEFEGRHYYVPSSSAVRALTVRGAEEVVKGYDVDGIHFDDYFYPVGAVAADTPAPFEETAYRTYREQGGKESVAAWRRMHVSALMASVWQVCHAEENCAFGVSPAYDIDRVRDTQYADVEEWASTKGYVDYLCPQLYVGFEHQYAPFAQELARWTTLFRADSVALLAGLAFYKTGLPDDPYAGSGRTEWSAGGDIIARQLTLVRDSGWAGVALYSHASFEADNGRRAQAVETEAAALQAVLQEVTP